MTSETKKEDIDEKRGEGSHNVSTDFVLPNAEEELVKAELALKINQILKRKKLKQIEAAKILEADQSKISLLNCGRLSSFSIERLVRYLTLLNQDVDIIIKPSQGQKQYGTIRVLDIEA